MKQFVPDDGSVVAPVAKTVGTRFVDSILERAKAIYPDHAESRNNYVREKMVNEIDRLHNEIDRWVTRTNVASPMKGPSGEG